MLHFILWQRTAIFKTRHFDARLVHVILTFPASLKCRFIPNGLTHIESKHHILLLTPALFKMYLILFRFPLIIIHFSFWFILGFVFKKRSWTSQSSNVQNSHSEHFYKIALLIFSAVWNWVKPQRKSRS